VRSIVLLREPDPEPLLKHVASLATWFECQGRFEEAADIHGTVLAHAGAGDAHNRLQARLRRGFCRRVAGEYRWAADDYEVAHGIAVASRDRWSAIVARVGWAAVLQASGKTKAADGLMREAASACEKLVRAEADAVRRGPRRARG
jgi:hypothetical protein